MEKKIVTFKGITNVPDDGLNEPGDMAVLMNMRHKGGELVPCGKPIPTDLMMGKIRQALYHANSTFWLVLDNNGVLQEWSSSLNKRLKVENVSSFSIMGNMVIINFADRVEYALWKGKNYEYLGGLPNIPKLYIKPNITKYRYGNEGVLDNNPDSEMYNYRHQKGNIDKTLAYVYQVGGYVDRAWFKVGVKLFDGSYIEIDGVQEVSCFPNNTSNRTNGDITSKVIGVQKIWEEDGGTGEYFTELNYFVPEFTIVEELDKWKDVIASIDVFSTGSIMSYTTAMLTRDIAGQEVPPGIEVYTLKTGQQLKDSLINAEFYKVASFNVNGEVAWKIEDTSPSNIAVQDILKDVAVHSVIPQKAVTYNARLHTYNYKEKMFDGHTSASSCHSLTPSYYLEDIWTVYVHINTDDGIKVVKREDARYANTDKTMKHLYYFSYPDSRAFLMEIFSDGKELHLPLTPHPTRNEAYNVVIETVDVVLDGGTTNEYVLQNVPLIHEGGWRQAGVQPNVVNGIEYKNTLKVSAVDNPLYFPTAQTYKFEGEIKGLASNAEAISTGQFGQYPLFVFTDTGIWAMSVDASGQGAYTTQSPFCREVCNGAICPVSGGVVFSTDKGVMVISGGQVADLSAALDGFEVDFFEENATLWEAIFEKVGKDAVVNPMPIRQYIKGAVIAYNYHYNEIIVSNKALFKEGEVPYSYVYSLTNQVWSVIDTVFDLTTNKYPELVVFDKNDGKMYTFGDGEAWNTVVAITRPFTMGSLDFKRIRQAGLRTTFEGQLNFYVLGSVDGAVFKCITGKEYDADRNESEVQRDLITAMSRSKQYKYFAIAVVGNIKGRVSMAELLVDMGFANNKIR